MPDPALARRYATALFNTAAARSAVDAVEGDLDAAVGLLREHRAMHAFMRSPQVLDEWKVEMVHKVLGGKVHALVLHFLLLLLDKKRFDHVEEIAGALGHLADEHRGVVRARVTTATALSPELLDRLQERLAAITDKQIILDSRVDSSLIGGVTVVLGDRLLDGSVRRALGRLREELMAVSVI